MKDYFNNREQTSHILIMCMQQALENFANDNCLTESERKKFSKASKLIQDGTNEILERLGNPYRNKIVNTLKSNTVKLVGKYGATQDAISYASGEDLMKVMKDLQNYNCLGCEKCDYKNCGVYSALFTCGVDGQQIDNECPYKVGGIDFGEIDIL